MSIRKKSKIISRKCSICENEITVKLFSDGKYEGGNYFGKMKIDKEKFEYWECNECAKK